MELGVHMATVRMAGCPSVLLWLQGKALLPRQGAVNRTRAGPVKVTAILLLLLFWFVE